MFSLFTITKMACATPKKHKSHVFLLAKLVKNFEAASLMNSAIQIQLSIELGLTFLFPALVPLHLYRWQCRPGAAPCILLWRRTTRPPLSSTSGAGPPTSPWRRAGACSRSTSSTCSRCRPRSELRVGQVGGAGQGGRGASE